MSTPYTYLLYCIPTCQYYYGVRWSKRCSPSDFWKTYFTSSVYVKKLIQQHGKDAFRFDIRKTFKYPIEAKLWEQKVLQRLNTSKRNDFINKYDGRIIDYQNRAWVTKGTQSKFIDVLLLEDYVADGWKLGRHFSKKHKKKLSEGGKKYFTTHSPSNKGQPMSIEQRRKISKIRKGQLVLDKNPRAKRIKLYGKTYPCIKIAMKETGLSRFLCLQRGKLL